MDDLAVRLRAVEVENAQLRKNLAIVVEIVRKLVNEADPHGMRTGQDEFIGDDLALRDVQRRLTNS